MDWYIGGQCSILGFCVIAHMHQYRHLRLIRKSALKFGKIT